MIIIYGPSGIHELINCRQDEAPSLLRPSISKIAKMKLVFVSNFISEGVADAGLGIRTLGSYLIPIINYLIINGKRFMAHGSWLEAHSSWSPGPGPSAKFSWP